MITLAISMICFTAGVGVGYYQRSKNAEQDAIILADKIMNQYNEIVNQPLHEGHSADRGGRLPFIERNLWRVK